MPLLSQYDVVGFQTEADAKNFVRYLIAECNQMRIVASWCGIPAILVLGGERSGVSPEVIQAADTADSSDWAWQIRSMSRPPLLFCFIGLHCGLKKTWDQ